MFTFDARCVAKPLRRFRASPDAMRVPAPHAACSCSSDGLMLAQWAAREASRRVVGPMCAEVWPVPVQPSSPRNDVDVGMRRRLQLHASLLSLAVPLTGDRLPSAMSHIQSSPAQPA
ncbi:hypothetical protein DPSP01_002501 [Paraphaeosphaeria sporulosa]